MIITEAKHEIITETDPLKKIELIARTCYKSEDKITEGSDIKMVSSLIARQHTAMLEHANVAIEVTKDIYDSIRQNVNEMIETGHKYLKNTGTDMRRTLMNRSYLRFTKKELDKTSNRYRFVISGNIRAWYDYFNCPIWYDHFEDGVMEMSKELYVAVNEYIHGIFTVFDESSIKIRKKRCRVIKDITKLSPEERMIHEDISIRFITDRGITHELVRMREASFAQESTRYCNYANDKFGSEITFIKPCFESWDEGCFRVWEKACWNAEKRYFELVNICGAKPQEARDVLPTSVKSEIVVTTNLLEWYHIFNLRACDATGPAHPQMHEIMIPAFNELKTSHSFAFGTLETK